MSFKQEHGSTNLAELAELALKPEDIIDFSSNCCPYSLFDDIDKPSSDIIQRYPDISNQKLYSAIGELCEVKKASLSLGNGATELIYAICRAYLNPDDNVLISTPTFSEYEKAALLCGAKCQQLPLTEHYQFDAQLAHHTVATLKPKLVFICNPNNPTGSIINQEELEDFNKKVIKNGGLLVVDEAYLPFIKTASLAATINNTITLRSLTKDCAIPGLRLGYAIAKPKISACINKQLPPWNINALAQYYGGTMLQRYDEVRALAEKTLSESTAFRNALSQNGWNVLASNTHYFLVDVGDACTLRRKLLNDYHINVRDCTSFGLPRLIRISSQTAIENTQFAAITFNSLF